MTNPYFLESLASERIRELHAAADRDRLRMLARCCKPATWLAAARRVRSFIADTQLGPRYDAPCCP
jgi:hypothetical protein